MYIQHVMTCLLLTEISFFVKVRIGRIAGQYAKPRSSSHEIIDGKQVMSFRWEGAHEIATFAMTLTFWEGETTSTGTPMVYGLFRYLNLW